MTQREYMKIAIISDTHDNVLNLEKAIEWMNNKNISQIIHCGDLCAPATLKEVLAPKFKGTIHMVFGNGDDADLILQVAEQFKHVKYYNNVGEIEIDKHKIAFVHFPKEAKELAQSGKYDFVFYGHTHKPWIEKMGKTEILNPGTLAGMFSKATFAVWNTENGEFELKILEKI